MKYIAWLSIVLPILLGMIVVAFIWTWMQDVARTLTKKRRFPQIQLPRILSCERRLVQPPDAPVRVDVAPPPWNSLSA
jgi:uncharacterized membrane protein